MDKLIINTKELIDRFGNDIQKKSYLKTKKLYNKTKISILKKANLFCNISDLGRGKYEIIEEYKMPKNKNIQKIIENDIYSILAPIIISKLIDSKINQEKMLNLSLINYYDLMNLVHKNNYNNIRYSPKLASKNLDLEIRNINNYFIISNEKLRYYLEACLDILQKSKIIVYIKIPFVKIRNVKLKNNYESVTTQVQNKHRRASEDEIRHREDCITLICDKYSIEREDVNKIFFDPRLTHIKNEYNDLLIQKNIIYFYSGYEVYYTDINKSNKFMGNFLEFNESKYIKEFISLMSEIINKSLNNRYTNINVDDIEFLNKNILDYTKKTLDIKNIIISNTQGEYHSYENKIIETEE